MSIWALLVSPGLVAGTVNVSHACLLHFFVERSVLIPTGGWVGLVSAMKIDNFVLPEHLHLCPHVECLPGINTILSGHWRKAWSIWLKFDYVFLVAGNSRFLQTAQPSPAAFAACIPLPIRWPILVSQVWQSPQSAWSAQSWPCSSISSHASTVLFVRVSLFCFPVLPHSLPVWTHKSRSVGMQSCLWPGTIPAWLQHCHCRWSVQAFCGRLGVVWAAADRQPRHELTDAVCNSEGRSDVSVVTGGAFSIKTSWERFLLLWLLWPICVSDVLMAACSNTTASLLPC